MGMPIYLSSPSLSGYEMQWIGQMMHSQGILPFSETVRLFEQEIAHLTGTRAGVAVNSGTAAIHLALRLIGVTPGDEVFCSSLTFVASANPIRYLGATPVFIDSEPATWNMSPIALERALLEAEAEGRLPKAVIVVNLYGQSADYEPIVKLCSQYGVPIIEEAAESLGATYLNAPSGSFGQFAALSFNCNKMITTAGGGMLVSDDIEALQKARFYASQAKDRAPHYQHSEMGYNYQMSSLAAAMGRSQVPFLQQFILKRRAIYHRYQQAFDSAAGISMMPEHAKGWSTHWLTALTIDAHTGITAADVVKQLSEQQIESRVVWKPLHLQPLFADCRYYPHQEDESVSDRLFVEGVCLPSGADLLEADQQRVIEAVVHILQGNYAELKS